MRPQGKVRIDVFEGGARPQGDPRRSSRVANIKKIMYCLSYAIITNCFYNESIVIGALDPKSQQLYFICFLKKSRGQAQFDALNVSLIK